VPIDPDWLASYYSSHHALDIIGIEVPNGVWSYLGVTVAKPDYKPPEKCSVRLYGFDGPKPAMAMGLAKSGRGFGLVHTASTEAGWSGTPLMRNGKVVGMHRGSCPSGTSNIGSLLQPLLLCEESFDQSKAWNRVADIDGDYDEFDFLVKGRKARVRAARGEFSVKTDPDHEWECRGRKWSDCVDEDDGSLPEFPLFESRNTGQSRAEDAESKDAFERPSRVERERSEFGVRRNLTHPSDAAVMRSSGPQAATAVTEAPVGADTDPSALNAQAPAHSAGVTHNSRFSESTSGTIIPQSESTDGKSAASLAASSSPRLSQKKQSSGHRSSALPGRTEGRQQKSEASTSKQPSAPSGVTKAAKGIAPEPSTLPSSKTLQARVDGLQVELTKQQVSSESGAKANTLLKDLLSCVMRYESKRV